MTDLLSFSVKQVTLRDSNRFFFEPDITSDDELADYYRHQLKKSASPKDVLFFINGLRSLLQVELNIEFLQKNIKNRIKFFNETCGYTLEDVSRHCGVSAHVVSKILNNKEISLNSILLTGYYLVPEFKHQLLNG